MSERDDGPSLPRPMRLWGRAAMGLLLAAAAVHALEIVGVLGEISIIERSMHERIAESVMLDNEARMRVIGYAIRGVHLLCIVTFIAFFFLAYQNLMRFGEEPRRGSHWAILLWFIPIVNLVLSLRMSGELWDKTFARDENDGPAIAWPVALWWAVWASAGLLTFVTAAAQKRAETLEQHLAGDYWQLAGAAAYFVAALLAANMVRAIAKAQDARAPSAIE